MQERIEIAVSLEEDDARFPHDIFGKKWLKLTLLRKKKVFKEGLGKKIALYLAFLEHLQFIDARH